VERTLTVNIAGEGTVVSSPAGIDCGSVCTATFNDGETIRLTATPDSGWSLLGWSWLGSGPECEFDESTTNTCDVTLTADTEVTAEFKDSSKEGEQPAKPPDDNADDPPAGSASTPPPASDAPPAPLSPGFAFFARIGKVKGNKALIRTHCAGDTRCRGVARLFVQVKRKGAGKGRDNRRRARRFRNVLVGKGRFRVAPRKAGVLLVRLTRPGRKLLHRRGRRGLRVRLVGQGLKNRVVTLRPQEGKRHR
jgi:hypothetical protein